MATEGGGLDTSGERLGKVASCDSRVTPTVEPTLLGWSPEEGGEEGGNSCNSLAWTYPASLVQD